MEPQLVDYYNEMPHGVHVIEKLNEEFSILQQDKDELTKKYESLKEDILDLMLYDIEKNDKLRMLKEHFNKLPDNVYLCKKCNELDHDAFNDEYDISTEYNDNIDEIYWIYQRCRQVSNKPYEICIDCFKDADAIDIKNAIFVCKLFKNDECEGIGIGISNDKDLLDILENGICNNRNRKEKRIIRDHICENYDLFYF